MIKFRELVDDMLHPKGIRCIVCGRDYPHPNSLCLCDKCTLSFNTEFCLSCGRAIPRGGVYCDDCHRKRGEFEVARAPFVYEGEAMGLMWRLKYRGAQWLAPYLAVHMAELWMRMQQTVEAIAFVPMYPKRENKRGYNQAKLLAEHTAKILGLPCVEMLERVIDTKPFAVMTSEERRRTIAGSIRPLGTVSYKRILLIDDVFTTGTTASECAHILKKAGAKTVYVLTAATARKSEMLY